MDKEIFCLSRSCPIKKECIRNVIHENYPKGAGELIHCVFGCKNYILFLENEVVNENS